jgi:hypothetical protein
MIPSYLFKQLVKAHQQELLHLAKRRLVASLRRPR